MQFDVKTNQVIEKKFNKKVYRIHVSYASGVNIPKESYVAPVIEISTEDDNFIFKNTLNNNVTIKVEFLGD